MSPFLTFLYALFGVACALALRAFAQRRGGSVAWYAWVAYLVWYVAVVSGFAFTVLNIDGHHRQAAVVGGIGTIVALVVLGFIVYRLACTPLRRRTS